CHALLVLALRIAGADPALARRTESLAATRGRQPADSGTGNGHRTGACGNLHTRAGGCGPRCPASAAAAGRAGARRRNGYRIAAGATGATSRSAGHLAAAASLLDAVDCRA